MPRVLLDGLAFAESARWHAGCFWVADWGAGDVVAVSPAGARETVARVPSAPVCFDWLPDGRLLVVSGGDGRVWRQERDGALVLHADLSGLSPHPWNEIVVDARGAAYVDGIGYDFPDGAPATGFVARVAPDGSVRAVAGGLAFPNGLALTPDGATLIVAESHGRCLTAFDVAADGALSGRRVWAALDGYPDGICLDAEGAVWVADVPNQRCVRVREGGEVAQTVALDRGAFSCALGDHGRTLGVAANAWDGAAGRAAAGQFVTVDLP